MNNWLGKCLFITVLCQLLFFEMFESALDSSEDTIIRFCQCLMNQQLRSPYFSKEEKENMTIVADMMISSLRRIVSSKRPVPPKFFLNAFATSMVSIVTADSETKEQKKEEHITALQHCSTLVTGSVDIEFLKENVKIMSAFERNKHQDNPSFLAPFTFPGQSQAFQSSEQRFSMQPSNSKSTEFSTGPQVGSYSQARDSSSASSITSPGTMPQNQNIQTSMRHALLSSSTFHNVFNPGISVQLATDISKGITKIGMSGYNPVLVNETVIAVSSAVSKMHPRSISFDYANTISNAAVSILRQHGISHPDHEKRIANGMIAHLNAITRRRLNIDSVASRFRDQIPDSSYEMLSSESESEASRASTVAFGNEMVRLLSQDEDISNVFCKDYFYSTRPEITYRMIKAGLVDIDDTVSSVAADNCANELSELTTDSTCAEYAARISKIVTNILQINELLKECDPPTIVKKMREYLQHEPIVLGRSLYLQVQAKSAPVAREEPFAAARVLQPSFPTMMQDSQQSVRQSNTPSEQSEFPGMPVTNNQRQNVDKSEIRPSAVQPQGLTSPFSSSSRDTQTPPLQPQSTQRNFDSASPGVPNSHYRNIPKNVRPTDDPTLIETSTTSGQRFRRENTSASEISLHEHNSKEASKPEFGSTNFQGSNSESAGNYSIIQPEPSTSTLLPTTSTTVSEEYTSSTKTATPLEGFAITEPFFQEEFTMYGFTSTTETNPTAPSFSTTPVEPTATPFSTTSVKPNVTYFSTTPLEYFVEKYTTTRLPRVKTTRSSATQAPKSSPIEKGRNTTITQSEESPVSNARAGDRETSGEYNSSKESSEEESSYGDFYDFEDPSVQFAQDITDIAQSSMVYIKSKNFDFIQLCRQLNAFSPIIDIPPVRNCSELAVIDYLLHVLRTVTKVLSSV